MNNILLSLTFLLQSIIICSQENRYSCTTTLGILSGTSASVHAAPLSFISEHHYRFHRIMSAGLMTGIEQLNENTLPCALNYRLFVPSGAFRPYLAAYTGYSVALEKPEFMDIDKAHGGILAGAETGAMIRINGCASLIFGFGYRYSELHYTMLNSWFGEYKRNFTFNRVSIRLGLVI